jgi:hypothetical protein
MRVRRDRPVRLAVTCPPQQRARCAGRLTLETVRRYRTRSGARLPLRLAGRTFSIAQGSSRTLLLRFTKAGRRALRPGSRVRVRVTLAERDRRGRTVLTRKTLTFRVVRR